MTLGNTPLDIRLLWYWESIFFNSSLPIIATYMASMTCELVFGEESIRLVITVCGRVMGIILEEPIDFACLVGRTVWIDFVLSDSFHWNFIVSGTALDFLQRFTFIIPLLVRVGFCWTNLQSDFMFDCGIDWLMSSISSLSTSSCCCCCFLWFVVRESVWGSCLKSWLEYSRWEIFHERKQAKNFYQTNSGTNSRSSLS